MTINWICKLIEPKIYYRKLCILELRTAFANSSRLGEIFLFPNVLMHIPDAKFAAEVSNKRQTR